MHYLFCQLSAVVDITHSLQNIIYRNGEHSTVKIQHVNLKCGSNCFAQYRAGAHWRPHVFAVWENNKILKTFSELFLTRNRCLLIGYFIVDCFTAEQKYFAAQKSSAIPGKLPFALHGTSRSFSLNQFLQQYNSGASYILSLVRESVLGSKSRE